MEVGNPPDNIVLATLAEVENGSGSETKVPPLDTPVGVVVGAAPGTKGVRTRGCTGGNGMVGWPLRLGWTPDRPVDTRGSEKAPDTLLDPTRGIGAPK